MSPSCEQLAPLNCTSDQLQVEPSTNQLTSSTPNLHVLPTASTLFASPAELNNDLASRNTVQSSQCQQQNPQQKQFASKPLFGPWNVHTNRNNARVHGEENTVFAGGGEDDGYGKGAQGISAWRQISVKCRGRGDGRVHETAKVSNDFGGARPVSPRHVGSKMAFLEASASHVLSGPLSEVSIESAADTEHMRTYEESAGGKKGGPLLHHTAKHYNPL
mmetsp:Transcript_73253/g.118867  ORF Transcript_73253/g.118867 Transcript_73253/m.118867 type:complete len:218 (-) Transcript_73253:756-1409(-)